MHLRHVDQIDCIPYSTVFQDVLFNNSSGIRTMWNHVQLITESRRLSAIALGALLVSFQVGRFTRPVTRAGFTGLLDVFKIN